MAGKITAMGGSLDVNSIVSQLMNVERAPLAKLQKEQAGINTKLSAWGTVKSALSELQTAAEKLIKQDTWNATTASSSNEDQVQATGGNSKGGATGAAGAAAAPGAGTGTMSAATAALLSGSAGSQSGVAGMLSARLKEILDDDGSLSGTTKALRRSLDASTSRADRLNEQLERTEERLLKQYAALDKNISNITNSFSSIASLLR